MKILNLVDIDKSDIKYLISKFPDGQQQVTITGEEEDFHTGDGARDHWWEKRIVSVKAKYIEIKARLNNFQDLELIICATKSLRGLGVKEIHLYTPYFLGSRSDRKFEEGSNGYLKDIICPIINSLNFESVTVLDPHSYVLEACLNNFRREDNKQLLGFAIKEIYGLPMDFTKNINNCLLVSPDAGASHKIYKLAEQIGYKGDIITCSKERDNEGKLTKCVIPYHRDLICPLVNPKNIIIIDDICDGGATFINIAKEIKNDERYGGNKIYLIITHGIFSKGFGELSKYFKGIYCTNSYKDLKQENFIGSKFDHDKVKQLNVF